MKIWYDTEFLEDGKTIELISIGMVAEDGSEYYAVSKDMPERRIRKHPWLMANVVPGLPQVPGDSRLSVPKSWLYDPRHPAVKPRQVIAREVRDFITAKRSPELWAWYGAYDHVVLCQLWGRMIDLPKGVPMFTCDIKQEAERLGNPPLPEQEKGLHNALEDARYNKVIWEHLQTLAATQR